MDNIQQFWKWFTAESERLTMLSDLEEGEQQTLREELQHQLDLIHEGLGYEISGQSAQGRTLTFTAEGDSDLFRYIVELVDNAPDIDWWEFTAFKQPQGKALRVAFDRYRFDTSKMYFKQLECEEEPDMLGLRIALPKEMMKPIGKADGKVNPEDDDLLVGVYVTIEALIGEFDCATLLGYIDTCPAPAEPFKEGYQPLDDLIDFVEWFKRKRDQ